MTEQTLRSGRCACGDVRYRVSGEPVRLAVCHCKDCQLRTGSAFGISCYFPQGQFTLLSGELNTFQRSSDAGRWLKLNFCPSCGTTVMWTMEVMPDTVGIAAGTFDDSSWIQPGLHVWTGSAQKWTHIPDDVEVFQQSGFRKN